MRSYPILGDTKIGFQNTLNTLHFVSERHLGLEPIMDEWFSGLNGITYNISALDHCECCFIDVLFYLILGY